MLTTACGSSQHYVICQTVLKSALRLSSMTKASGMASYISESE